MVLVVRPQRVNLSQKVGEKACGSAQQLPKKVYVKPRRRNYRPLKRAQVKRLLRQCAGRQKVHKPKLLLHLEHNAHKLHQPMKLVCLRPLKRVRKSVKPPQKNRRAAGKPVRKLDLRRLLADVKVVRGQPWLRKHVGRLWPTHKRHHVPQYRKRHQKHAGVKRGVEKQQPPVVRRKRRPPVLKQNRLAGTRLYRLSRLPKRKHKARHANPRQKLLGVQYKKPVSVLQQVKPSVWPVHLVLLPKTQTAVSPKLPKPRLQNRQI